ncbi:hypothetical protein DGo_CA1974 [Deinococcus gobiensis I-0]|uniref:Uncharacterized protein n=1 Tax=Deinococcus gobiensis (strain DSM 21396 / JCM 16679 / CGMCC 1.7299 / I-0) TaxID=745776 RepID=H8GXP9_DEIGI|nr:hypothetical protein DGo_CA1974 [Deinococcus gobiensis I-0]
MSIATDLHTRLRAALPPEVPVLPPEDLEMPKGGRKPGQAAGLVGYLTQHPQGYVQVEEPLPISANSVTATFWVAVAATAASPTTAAALALLVRRALAGSPRDPGPYPQVTPAEAVQLSPGVWTIRPTYQVLTVDGMSTALQE